MNKKVGRIITIIAICIAVVIALGVFVLNYSSNDNELSLTEKKWISDHANSVIDVSVFNDVPVYGNSGNGVIFDFLDKFNQDYSIEFNKDSYYISSNENKLSNVAFKVLDDTEEVANNQILFYQDEYVLIGNNNDVITDLSLVSGKIGVLKSDLSVVSYYLDLSSDNFETYEDIDSLIKGFSDKEVMYITIPKMINLDKIIKNKFNIVYHMADINKKYVLEVSDKDLFDILNKYYAVFSKEYFSDSYSKNFLDIYFDNSESSPADRVNYNSSVYTYGYVANTPYEDFLDGKFTGIIADYLKEFQSVANVEVKMVKFDSINELKAAILSGDIDFALANFDKNSFGSNFTYTKSVIDFEYVVLSKKYYDIRDITSLKKYDVSVVADSSIDSLLKSKQISTISYKDTNDLLRNIDDNSVVMVNRYLYNYYSTDRFSNFNVLLDGTDVGYSFIIDSNNNKTFANLFTTFADLKNYGSVKSLYDTNNRAHFISTPVLIVALVLCLFLLSIIIITFSKTVKIRQKKKNSKGVDDKLKFVDVMTSLKNRNFLKYTIAKWDDNVIYPQAIVVIDLNNIKDINDAYGHEKGDEVIKQAANILISNQLEKTDLIRSDGNEFLIYMVGYDSKQVITYARKIYKEFKSLPYGFGASIGYSMIEDDLKTIEDAINEATIDMQKNKENEKK